MQFEFEQIASLPLLAWSARVLPGGVVRVLHGSGVEVRDDAFVEGAWDGDFDSMGFDEAIALAGSGGRMRGDSVVFSTPFHTMECLYLLRSESGLIVSNSIAFLFVEASDGPYIHHSDYFFDLQKVVQNGIPNFRFPLPTRAGRSIWPFQFCNVRVTADLHYQEMPKTLPPSPVDYAAWYAQMLETVGAVARNATSPARKRTYRLVSAISTGYDSTAAAAFAAKAGGKEAITFSKSSFDGNLVDDSGEVIASHLGMIATCYDRMDVRKLPGLPEAEFFTNPGNLGEVGLRVVESQLKGALFTTGRYSGITVGADPGCKWRQNVAEPDIVGLPGRGGTDFRIRLGYLNFPLLQIAVTHARRIYRITHSPEMRPWRMDEGSYDCPISRRLVEEAGVPRALFGQQKLGGGGRDLRYLNEASEKDFQAFCNAEVPPEVLKKLDRRRPVDRDREHYRLNHIRKRIGLWPGAGPLLRFSGIDRWHAMWNSLYLYRFHWGFDRIADRYRV